MSSAAVVPPLTATAAMAVGTSGNGDWHTRRMAADFVSPSTFASWMSIGIYLSTVGITWTDTKSPITQTMIALIGLVFMIWAMAVYFPNNWNVHGSYAHTILLLILCLFAFWVLGTLIHSWIKRRQQ
jgi:CDP-diglyceride synthetase